MKLSKKLIQRLGLLPYSAGKCLGKFLLLVGVTQFFVVNLYPEKNCSENVTIIFFKGAKLESHQVVWMGPGSSCKWEEITTPISRVKFFFHPSETRENEAIYWG